MSVLGFDFDSTLVKAFTAIPLPGVAQRIAALPPDQRIFIATNQAGPVFRAVTGDAKYPTAAQVARQLVDGLDAVGLLGSRSYHLAVLVATAAPQLAGSERAAYQVAQEIGIALSDAFARRQIVTGVVSDPGWRKPAPGMLKHAAWLFTVPPADLLFIGDMESDRLAADAAGAQYLDAAAWVRGES